MEFVRLFTRAQKLMRGITDEELSRHGVRVGQNLVLEVLWEDDGLTPGELAARLGVATPTVVKSVGRMEAVGLLTRRPDERDGRLVRIHLTEHGRAVREPIEAARRRLEERVAGPLTDEERVVLRRVLTRIIDDLG
jgi:MarR family transcriptional regulator, organic hydroperoxide resistance regulator